MLLRRALLTLLIVACLAGGALAYLIGRTDVQAEVRDYALGQLDSPASEDAREVTFTVHPGESASEIAAGLEETGLVTSASSFQILARMRGVQGKLRSGKFSLSPSMTPTQILDVLTDGELSGTVVILPGSRAAEIADQLSARGIVNRDEFVALIREGEFDNDFLLDRPEGASLEGYLAPGTYQFAKDTPAREVIQRLLDKFGEDYTLEMREKTAERGLTVHQLVTLASIVEREIMRPEERPMVAGVYMNRLNLGMKLQADPTVQYAIAGQYPKHTAAGYWKVGLTDADLDYNSPYNTYRYDGLPPGPISNPGAPSMAAVLDPTKSDYFYFVAKPDGTHAFAKTLQEHNANVARIKGGG
jgi:peptidoglycan lytic transglycosylase G